MLSTAFLNLSSLISNCNLALTPPKSNIFLQFPLLCSGDFPKLAKGKHPSCHRPWQQTIPSVWCLPTNQLVSSAGPVGHQLESCRYYVSRELFFDDVVSLSSVSSKPVWQVCLANVPANTAVIIIESTKLDLVFQVHISPLVTAVFCYLSIFNLQTTVHIIFPVAFEMCGRVLVRIRDTKT